MLGGLFNSLSGASDSARQFILVRRGLRELLNFPWGQNTSWTSLEKLSANFTFFLRQVCALGFLPFWGVKQQTKDLICWAGVLWGGLGDNGRAGDMGRGTPALRGGTAARLGRSEAPAPPSPMWTKACLHILWGLFQDSGLKDHFRTFTRHPGIALGSSHKIRHPNSPLSLMVQSSFLSNLRDGVT